MNRLLVILMCLITGNALAQPDFLFIKKGGKKKRTFTYGNSIDLRLINGDRVHGRITGLRNDTIYIGMQRIPRADVKAVVLHEKTKKPFPADAKTLLLIGGGAGLTTIGLPLDGRTTHKQALIAGNKFRLQVFDVYIPPSKAF